MRRAALGSLSLLLLSLACGNPPPGPEPELDTTAPALKVTSPAEGGTVPVFRVRLGVEVSDEGGLREVRLQHNGGAWLPMTQVDDSGYLDLQPVPGRNTVKVEAEDLAGNVTEAVATFHYGSRISGGGGHSGAVKEGSLYAWGRNNRGQVGNSGMGTDVLTPVKLGISGEVAAIAFNQNNSLALRADGTVLSWGDNASKQLGLGTAAAPEAATFKAVPVEVPGISDAVAVAMGYTHSLVLRRDGTVLSFGLNTSGQLGTGAVGVVHGPQGVKGLTGVIKIAAGSAHSVALRADGTVWTWGRNASGALGLGTEDSLAHPTPAQVPELGGVIDIAAGRDHVLALAADGKVYAWGLNASGQVGNGLEDTDSFSPAAVKGLSDATAVWANGNYSFVARADGTLHGFGQGDLGQLGTGSIDSLLAPGAAVIARNSGQGELSGCVAVALAPSHVLALQADGTLLGWGWSNFGSLGRADALQQWKYTGPLEIPLP